MENDKTENIENQQSVKIKINQKGLYSGEVKVYASTIEDAMWKAKEKAQELEELLNEKNERS